MGKALNKNFVFYAKNSINNKYFSIFSLHIISESGDK